MIAALAVVDYVVLFRERTVTKVIQALQPDVQVKGTDYTAQGVPERAPDRGPGCIAPYLEADRNRMALITP